VRTTIDLPEPVLRSAKRRAAERNVTLSVVIQDALVLGLAAKPKAPVKPFTLFTVKGKALPGIDLDRTSALVVMDDEETYSPQARQ
jgi:hypothetical protein